MILKKIITFASVLFFITSLASAQSLVELARKEKERRENLKKKAKVVTNIDLAKSERKTALIIERSEIPTQETATEITRSEESVPRKVSEVEREEEGFKARRAELEAKWKRAQEYVDLLTTKINGLWQEFYSQDDVSYREKTQSEIREFHLKLQKARQEEDKAKQELEKFLADSRKQGIPPGWIR